MVLIAGSSGEASRWSSLGVVSISAAVLGACALHWVNGDISGGPQWAKWPVALACVALAIHIIRSAFRGICAFTYDGVELVITNLVTRAETAYELASIADVRHKSNRFSRDIVLKNGDSIIVGLWGVTNVDRLLAQLKRDIANLQS